MRENLYLNTAQFYDGGNDRNFSEDIEFYKSFITPNTNVLDVGCGTGRVALELVKEDVNITCIDLSKAMLDIFREKLGKIGTDHKERIEIIEADMVDFELNKKFDLIIFPFRVFQALTNDTQRVKCLKAIIMHINPDGNVIINVFNPIEKILANIQKSKTKDYQYYDEKSEAIVTRYSEGVKNDDENQILHLQHIFEVEDKNGVSSQIEEDLKLGYQTKSQMDVMFERYNLNVENLYSWWDRSDYSKDNKRELIYVLTKN